VSRQRVAYLQLLLAVVVIGLTACASGGPPARLNYGIGEAPEGRRVFWPPEPEIPRYLYAGQLTGEENFVHDGDKGGVRSFFRWLVGLVGGEDAPIILQRPQAVTGDAQGRIYVTDVSRAAVLIFDAPAGELKVREYASGLKRFVSPIGIAVAADGSLWVADAQLALIAHLDPRGKTLPPLGFGQLHRPTGIALDAAKGELYVSDTYDHDIKVFATDGRLLRTLGSRGEAPGQFNYPTHLALADGHLYVTDTMNNRIQVMPLAGGEPQIIGERGLYYGNLVRPKGVAVDSEHNVYIVESYYDNLLVFDREGRFLMPIGGVGQGTGKFYLPAGVWVDGHDRVFVADTFNGRIAVFQYLGRSGERDG